MNIRKILAVLAITVAVPLVMANSGCDDQPTTSDSGVAKYSIKLPTDNQGRSIEQRLIAERLTRTNKPGAMQYIYFISPFTGTVIDQGIVFAKVVSSGKRLSPRTVNSYNTNYNLVKIGDKLFTTDELIEDDGTFGSSIEYFFWIDVRTNAMQQAYPQAVFTRISEVPLVIRNATLTMEVDHGAEVKNRDIAPEVKKILEEFGVLTLREVQQ